MEVGLDLELSFKPFRECLAPTSLPFALLLCKFKSMRSRFKAAISVEFRRQLKSPFLGLPVTPKVALHCDP